MNLGINTNNAINSKQIQNQDTNNINKIQNVNNTKCKLLIYLIHEEYA